MLFELQKQFPMSSMSVLDRLGAFGIYRHLKNHFQRLVQRLVLSKYRSTVLYYRQTEKWLWNTNFSTTSVNFNRLVLPHFLSNFDKPYIVGKLFKSTFICHQFQFIWSCLQKVMIKTLQCCQAASLVIIFQLQKLFWNNLSIQIMQIILFWKGL